MDSARPVGPQGVAVLRSSRWWEAIPIPSFAVDGIRNGLWTMSEGGEKAGEVCPSLSIPCASPARTVL